MIEELKVGDTVILKSGSPRMTIDTITNNEVLCVWINNNKTEKEIFNIAMLKTFKFDSGF